MSRTSMNIYQQYVYKYVENEIFKIFPFIRTTDWKTIVGECSEKYFIKKLAPKGVTAQNINFSIKDFFFCKCDQILRIWSDLLKKSLMENFIFVQCVGRGRVPKTYVLKKTRNLGKVELMKYLRKYKTSLS